MRISNSARLLVTFGGPTKIHRPARRRGSETLFRSPSILDFPLRQTNASYAVKDGKPSSIHELRHNIDVSLNPHAPAQ
jgi:hypothetical protein